MPPYDDFQAAVARVGQTMPKQAPDRLTDEQRETLEDALGDLDAQALGLRGYLHGSPTLDPEHCAVKPNVERERITGAERITDIVVRPESRMSIVPKETALQDRTLRILLRAVCLFAELRKRPLADMHIAAAIDEMQRESANGA